MALLDKINSPQDIKNFKICDLKKLAKEIRQVILDTVMDNGGHLASNLGCVELIIAMHYVFDSPNDKFVFDVGHQCYTHKLLTGRFSKFNTLRKMNGLAGFPKREESIHDIVNTGHSSTSISVNNGLTRALELDGNEENIVVTIIGDGALTGGLAYEALNEVSNISKKQLVILNDNSMSISPNVGSMARYLLKLHNNTIYQKVKKTALNAVEYLSDTNKSKTYRRLDKIKKSAKYFLQGGLPFDQFEMNYFGPIDGHDLEELINAFTLVKKESESVLLHIITKKGRGFIEAEQSPGKFHGYSTSSGKTDSFSSVFGDVLTEIALKDNKIVAITAAMGEGVGLDEFSERFGNRFVDVGIAEGHALCMASGLALGNYKPYFAVYSTFLQRAYDQVIHDMCLQNLPIKLCIDRAGIVPADGETHQGIYDLAFLRLVPNIAIISPINYSELKKVLYWSKDFNTPLAIRYPKGEENNNFEIKDIQLGKWNTIIDGRDKIAILNHGALMAGEAIKIVELLREKGLSIKLINASFAKPLDSVKLDSLDGYTVITLEDNVLAGGFGSAVAEYIVDKDLSIKLKRFGIKDNVLTHATIKEILKMQELTAEQIVAKLNF